MSSRKKPFYVNASILLLITIVAWILFSIYQALSTTTSVEVPAEVLENFEARLDAEALIKLQQSIYLTDSEIEENTVVVETEVEELEELEEEEIIEEEVVEVEEEIPADEEVQP